MSAPGSDAAGDDVLGRLAAVIESRRGSWPGRRMPR
jgi:hypothetical protein